MRYLLRMLLERTDQSLRSDTNGMSQRWDLSRCQLRSDKLIIISILRFSLSDTSTLFVIYMHVYVQIHYGKRLDIFGGTDTIHQSLPWGIGKGNLRSLDIIGETDHTDSLPSTWNLVCWLICERGGELTKTDTGSDTSV